MELVCPAGNLPSLKAAVDNGANAVYLGFRDDTNARNFAGLNFDLTKMQQGIHYAHENKVNVFLTLNTYPHRRSRWQTAVDQAANLGVDALIIADIGVLDYATEHYPELARHLSVQGSATNYQAINFYYQHFGIQRVVLPRVLSLSQVQHLIQQTPVAVEIFGSLCVMVEGRCFLSSYVTGDSPNTFGACSPGRAVEWRETPQGLETRLGGVLIDQRKNGESAGYPTLCKGRYRVGAHTYYALIESLIPRVMGWLEKQQRPLITLNTRASAKKIWRALNKHFGENIPVYLISADLIPRDRLQKIAAIKTGEPCIVVSTQTIEAGVDIDMDVVIRDFAPLDALIQIAGRCNRNFKQGEQGGFVEVVSLISKNGRKYAEYVYDGTVLDATRDSLNPLEKTAENEILPLINGYFKLLKQRKNTGESLTKEFVYWKEMENVHSILRPHGEQIAFLVIDDEEGQQLVKQLQHALAIEERWEKRRTLQAFAAELSKRTVAVYNHKDFYPEKYINRSYLELFKDHGYAILKADYYDTQQGITLPKLDEDDPAVCIV